MTVTGNAGDEDYAIVASAPRIASINWLDWVQGGLDLVGLVLGLGEIADGANALIYMGRGDYANAALSAAAMIPIVGSVATGGKIIKKWLRAVLKY